MQATATKTRICLGALLVLSATAPARPAGPAKGPLRVHPENPRYFTDGTKNADGSLRAVYLTGSHTWNNLIDMDKADPPAPFDFEAYLDFLQRYGHNFIRLWTWDSTVWDTRANGKLGKDFVHHVAPLPWARTGPGNRESGRGLGSPTQNWVPTGGKSPVGHPSALGVPFQPMNHRHDVIPAQAGIAPAQAGDADATKSRGQDARDTQGRDALATRGHDARDTALDGKAKFDLTKFNPAYFERLRARVRAAGDRGIYVSVMLFEGWGLSHADHRIKTSDAWAYRSHPFHPDNNINGIRGDLNGDGNALEVHSLASPAITALQAAYIRKVVDTVNDLDNVLYEVINEGGNKDWDWWVVQTVHDYERTKPKQHPVGITGHGGERLATMIVSPADWISPGSQDGYRDPPPAWEGRPGLPNAEFRVGDPKVSLLDTDHVWGVGGNAAWAWKSFLRGHNPLFMDPYDGSILGHRFDPQFEPLRRALGQTRRCADRVNLAAMTPHSELASTSFCLANPGKEYLVYVPEGSEARVDLSAGTGPLQVEWTHPVEGTTQPGGEVMGGAERTFKAPFQGDAVLHLRGRRASDVGRPAKRASQPQPPDDPLAKAPAWDWPTARRLEFRLQAGQQVQTSFFIPSLRDMEPAAPEDCPIRLRAGLRTENAHLPNEF